MTTRYLQPWYNDALADVDGTTNARIRTPRAGTLRNMFVRQGDPSTDTDDVVYTIRKNGVATALTITIAGNVVDGSDTLNTVAVAQGDSLDVEVTKANPVTPAVEEVVVTVELV